MPKYIEHLKKLAVNYIKLGLIDVDAAADPEKPGRGLTQVADAMGSAWGAALAPFTRKWEGMAR